MPPLKVPDCDPEEVPSGSLPPRSTTPARELRVFLVDSDVTSGRALSRLLREDGFSIELAVDGALALSRLSKDPLPDVVISDLHLRGAEGMAVARYARSRNPAIEVIFVTTRPDLVRHGVLRPPAVVMSKPLDYPELKAQLGGLSPLADPIPSVRPSRPNR